MILIIFGLGVLGGFVIFKLWNGQPKLKEMSAKTTYTDMKITSSAFEEGGVIPTLHTCDGNDISFDLRFSDVPSDAKSLALVMDDPDAPAGIWDHWIVFNISPDTTKVLSDEEPIGIHGRGTSGNMDYHGPCPPDREHRYFVKLYALDTNLNLSAGVSKQDVEEAMGYHILAKAMLMGRYDRPR